MDDALRLALRDEMRRSEAIAISGANVLPRFRIVTPEGEYFVLVEMDNNPEHRFDRLKLLAGFMAWKMASAFVVAGETTEPNGIFGFAVTKHSAVGRFCQIDRGPGDQLSISQPLVLEKDQCDPAFEVLLPDAESEIDAETLERVQKAFGLEGEMPAARAH